MRFWKMKKGIMSKLCCDGWCKVGSKTAPMEIIGELRTLILSNNLLIKKIKFQAKTRYNNNHCGIKLNKTLK